MTDRYRSVFPRDEAHLKDGDVGWVGVNARLHPSQVPAGYASHAVNHRFGDGTARPRLGIAKLPWSNRVLASDRDAILPFRVIHGAGEFRDDQGRDWLIIAADGEVWKCRESNCATRISLPAGVTIDGPVRFVQAMKTPNEALLMLRGPANDPKALLVMESLDAGFTTPTVNLEYLQQGSGLIPAPASHWALYLQNRVIYIQYPDQLFVSDVLDYTVGSITDVWQANRGEGGEITALVKFTETSFLVFKDKAVHRITNFYLDLSQTRADLVTAEYGCKAPKTAIGVGADVWFLADRRGVVSIAQTDFDKIKAVDVPASHAIEPYIRRINWRLAHLAAAAYADNKYFLAVPLDAGEEVRADLVDHIAGACYTGTSYTLTVKAGRRYRYTQGFYEYPGGTLVNGTETLTQDGDFTAQGSTVTLTSRVSGSAVTAAVQPVFQGNNAVLVYDFVNQAWAGYDFVEVSPRCVFGDAMQLIGETFRILTEGGEPIASEAGVPLRQE